MKPRWHFILEGTLYLCGIILLAISTLYLVSFIVFFMRQSGLGLVFVSSNRGILTFLIHSPWILILTTGLFIGTLYILVRRYSFSYHKPFLYSLIGISIFSITGSMLIQQTTMHMRMQQFSEQRNLPVFTPLYKKIEDRRPNNITAGVIQSLNESGFIITSEQGETITVLLTPQTRQKPGTTYTINDAVFIAGDRTGDIINADGVRRMDNFNETRKGHTPPNHLQR